MRGPVRQCRAVPNDPDLQATEAIYDALDRGDPQVALELARAALGEYPDDPVLLFLCGRALMELDRPDEAAGALLSAVKIDPDDREFRVYGAWALFRACRFDEAATLLAAGPADERLPEDHWVRALLAERRGEHDVADGGFVRAAALDPEGFPRPVRFAPDEFGRHLEAARAALDEPFRGHLERVGLIVDDLPDEALLREDDPPLDPEGLLGLFVGVPLGDSESFSPGGELPPRIYLFKRNLERFVADAADLVEQIRVTLYHELGHYLGLDEDELERSGYG